MEMDFDITLDDFHLAQRLDARMSRRTKTILAVFIGLDLIVAVFFVAAGSEWAPLFLVPPVLVAVMRTVFVLAVLPQVAMQAYAQHKAAHVRQHIEISAEGVASSSVHGGVRLPWSHFMRWREDRHVLLLYQTDRQFVAIPKRAFRSEEDRKELVSLLGANGIPAA